MILPQKTQGQGSILVKNLRFYATCALLFAYLAYGDDPASALPDGYIEAFQDKTLWVIITGFICAFGLSFAVGANDSANSWGTAVGSKTMTLRMACILGSICETLGAVFLSGNVIKKLTTGIVKVDEVYKSQFNETTGEFYPAPNNTFKPEYQLMLGEVGVITGSAVWQIIASWFAWPVSGTHSVVGGILGFSLVASGTNGVNWIEIAKIAAAWVISPAMAAIFSIALYYPIRKYVVMAEDPLKVGKILFPILWGFTMLLNAGVVLTTGNLFKSCEAMGKSVDDCDKSWGLSDQELWIISGAIGLGVFILIAVIVWNDWIFHFEDYRPGGVMNKGFEEDNQKKEDETEDEEKQDQKETPIPDADEDTPETRRLFESLQYLSACSGSLAHGGNDVGNAIGPIVGCSKK